MLWNFSYSKFEFLSQLSISVLWISETIFSFQVSEKDRKILDIESELYEAKRQHQDAITSGAGEVKLIQLKVDQMTRFVNPER